MKEAHYNCLTRKFKDTMQHYSQIQEDYKQKMKQRLKKELQIADVAHKFDDDELDEMIEEGNMAIFDGGFTEFRKKVEN